MVVMSASARVVTPRSIRCPQRSAPGNDCCVINTEAVVVPMLGGVGLKCPRTIVYTSHVRRALLSGFPEPDKFTHNGQRYTYVRRKKTAKSFLVGRARYLSAGMCRSSLHSPRPFFSLKTVLPLSQVSDLQKKIAAAVARLKQQQNLYEAVRSDRNVYSKNLIETQASQSPFVVRSPGPARPTRRARTKKSVISVRHRSPS